MAEGQSSAQKCGWCGPGQLRPGAHTGNAYLKMLGGGGDSQHITDHPLMAPMLSQQKENPQSPQLFVPGWATPFRQGAVLEDFRGLSSRF